MALSMRQVRSMQQLGLLGGLGAVAPPEGNMVMADAGRADVSMEAVFADPASAFGPQPERMMCIHTRRQISRVPSAVEIAWP